MTLMMLMMVVVVKIMLGVCNLTKHLELLSIIMVSISTTDDYDNAPTSS